MTYTSLKSPENRDYTYDLNVAHLYGNLLNTYGDNGNVLMIKYVGEKLGAKMTFDIVLSAYLGGDPIAEVVKLWNYERGGIAVPLVIGNKGYGKYRWSVLDHKMKMKTYDGRGNVTSATVSVSLQEYLRG